jgi:6-phosphogluconolactonase
MTSVVVNRFKDAEGVAEAAAEYFVTRLAELLEQKPQVHVMLTGGTVGIATLSSISRREDAHLLEWSRVHIWWGDERFVAADSDQRNAVQARGALLSKIAVVESNIHEFPSTDAGLSLSEAEHLFSAEVLVESPEFDLAFVGMGPDGHVCSLFPGKSAPAEGALVMAEDDSPKPPQQRLSFTYAAMNSVAELIFVVAGADKASAVKQVFDESAEKLPAAKIRGKAKTTWFIDQTAATENWGC